MKLDFLGGISIVIGSILGSGIFIAPALIAQFSGSVPVALGFWILGGLVCAIGAAIYGSLGLLYPEGGGQYVYLRNSLGPKFSRFYGWASILVICPTMLAGTSLFFAEQWRVFLPENTWLIKFIAVASIVTFSFLNTLGIQVAGRIQKLLVLMHVALFLGVLVLSAWLLPGIGAAESLPQAAPVLTTGGFSKFVLAIAAVLWAFEGFNTVTFITNEIQGGERNVRRIALSGCVIVLALYLLFNAFVFRHVPPGILAQQQNVAAYLMNQIFGAKGGIFVLSLTILGIATVLHSSVIIGPRIITAAARDGLVWRKLGEIEPRRLSPRNALWFQCAAAVFYILFGALGSLITCFIVLNWLFYGLTVIGYLKIQLRALRPLQKHSVTFAFEAAGAALFLSMVGFLLLSQFIENSTLALFGLVVFVIGVFGMDGLVRRWGAIQASVGQRPIAPIVNERPELSSRP